MEQRRQESNRINGPVAQGVDLLEIYHARQLRDQIMAQLRRIRASNQHKPLLGLNDQREVRGYYEAMLLAVAELLHELGDDDLDRAS